MKAQQLVIVTSISKKDLNEITNSESIKNNFRIELKIKPSYVKLLDSLKCFNFFFVRNSEKDILETHTIINCEVSLIMKLKG